MYVLWASRKCFLEPLPQVEETGKIKSHRQLKKYFCFCFNGTSVLDYIDRQNVNWILNLAFQYDNHAIYLNWLFPWELSVAIYFWTKTKIRVGYTVYTRGGGVLPHISLIGICRPNRWGFGAFSVWKQVYTSLGIHFAYFGLESGMVYEGTTGVYKRIYRCYSKWIRTKKKCANSKRIWRIFLFSL